MPPICSPHPVSVWSINGELFSYFKKNSWKNIKRGLKPHDMGELYEIQILSPINSFTETWPCLFNSPSLPCSLSPVFPSPAILPYNLGRSWSGDFLPYSPPECRVPGLQVCTHTQLWSCVCDGCFLTAMTALSIWNREREAWNIFYLILCRESLLITEHNNVRMSQAFLISKLLLLL